MVIYYNRTRGPLAVTLANGKSVAVAPKKTLGVLPEEDASNSIMTHLKKGHLVRLAVQPEPVEISQPPAPVVVEPVQIEAAPAMVAEPVEKEEAADSNETSGEAVFKQSRTRSTKSK